MKRDLKSTTVVDHKNHQVSSIGKEVQFPQWLHAPHNFYLSHIFSHMWIHFLKIFQGLKTETCQQCTEFARFLTMYITQYSCAAVHEIPSRLYICVHVSIYLKFATLCINLVWLSFIYKVSGHKWLILIKTAVMSKLTMCPANPTPLQNLYCIGCTL